MYVSRASKHFGTFRKVKKMLTFQENINPKNKDTNDTHAFSANIVVLLILCLRILKQNAADGRV